MKMDQLIEKLKNATDSKEILRLRGELITVLKEKIATEENGAVKTNLDLMLYDEMKKHKEHISKMTEENKTKKVSIPEKVSLKVKEISTTIENFMKKKDVLGRIKSGTISAALSGVICGAFSLGFNALTGGTIDTGALIKLIPTVSYVGLSSLITGLTTDTQKSALYKAYEDAPEQTEKEINFCQKYISENEPFIRAIVQENKLDNINDKIKNEQVLIEEYKNIIEHAPSDQVRQILTMEKTDVMTNLLKNYSYLENEYLHGRVDMSKETYNRIKEKKEELELNIKVEGSFAKDTTKKIAKNIGKQTAITYASRLALAGLFPNEFQFKSFTDALTPFLYTLLGNAFTFGDVSKSIKMQKTDYSKTVIKMTHPELFEKNRHVQTSALQVA